VLVLCYCSCPALFLLSLHAWRAAVFDGTCYLDLPILASVEEEEEEVHAQGVTQSACKTAIPGVRISQAAESHMTTCNSTNQDQVPSSCFHSLLLPIKFASVRSQQHAGCSFASWHPGMRAPSQASCRSATGGILGQSVPLSAGCQVIVERGYACSLLRQAISRLQWPARPIERMFGLCVGVVKRSPVGRSARQARTSWRACWRG
jgi:hypothetical protein